jgi:predicted transcriptional regulator
MAVLMIEVEHEIDPDKLEQLAEYLDYIDPLAAAEARHLAHELRRQKAKQEA